MPEKQSSQNVQTQKRGEGWWIPALIGIIMLFIPGGIFVSPIMFLMAVLMRRNKSKESPETSPSPLPLINTKP